ncbi:MAG: hypothetical protein MPN21_15255 [Thermoanaerobaculia bacterium]|nr:hypothetical protein [Thermoanaerobaculia bacterium]
MSTFPGGSAFAMASQVAEGFLLITERTFKRMNRPDLEKLSFELEKLLRDIRGNQPDPDDVQEVQRRNRRIQRLNSCRMMLRAYRMKKRI